MGLSSGLFARRVAIRSPKRLASSSASLRSALVLARRLRRKSHPKIPRIAPPPTVTIKPMTISSIVLMIAKRQEKRHRFLSASSDIRRGPPRPSEAILGRLTGPDGNRSNARELYQSRRLTPPGPFVPKIQRPRRQSGSLLGP